MIEKVMRVVKSSNKKRGKNITIGAVVGFLLSCSTVMGAGVIGLEIKKDGNEIKFSKEGSPFTLENPYTGNSWKNNTYRNNMTISRYGSGGTVFGLKLNGNLGENFNFENNGRMNGSSYAGIGVEVDNVSMMGDIANRGILSGHGSIGYGIRYTRYSTSNITNTGIIYGKTNAIDNDYGTVNKAHNYGLLVNNNIERNVVSNNLIIAISTETAGKNKMKNYGLAFTATNFGYKNYNTSNSDFGASHFNKDIDGVTYTIINVGANVNSATKEIKDWRNLGIKNGKLYENAGNISSSEIAGFSSSKQYILNGIEDTLKIIGTDKNNILNNSIINAYKTALVMEGDSNLTLENTIVNGGLDGISSAISVTGNNNFLTIKGDSIVNGEMSATGDMNTLNLYGKEDKTRVDEDKSMNILHNIDGFGRIQIENEVTFFEDVKVTGVDRLNINNGGTLSLRLKAGATSNDKATHALSSGNLVLLIAGKQNDDDTAGTLNFIVNGMGTGTIIDMNGAELENVLLKASSIISKLKVLDNRDIELGTGEDLNKVYNDGDITPDSYPKYKVIPDNVNYNSLNKIYQSSVKDDDNVNAVIDMIDSTSDNKQWEKLLKFLGGVYTESPYSYSSELSRKSVGMFRDITTGNEFKPNLNNWLIMGGLTHTDGGTKDTYYGKNYYEIDSGSSNTNADMKLTGAYMLAKYSYSESLSLGLTLGGNKSEAKIDMSKVKGNSGYLGVFAENYIGNLTLKAGVGIQYSEYDADRRTIGGHSYNDKYSDMTYDIYLNGIYSHQVGDNLFLEPYATLSYTYIDQDGADEGSEALAIETDSKSFDYTSAKVGIDLKKIIPHSAGKSTLSAGISYTKIFDGADEEYITGRFKGGSDFDILVAHKNEHSIGLNAKYALELENGVLFDVKGTYSIERDSHNDSGKNKTKGEWIVGAGVGYKF